MLQTSHINITMARNSRPPGRGQNAKPNDQSPESCHSSNSSSSSAGRRHRSASPQSRWLQAAAQTLANTKRIDETGNMSTSTTTSNATTTTNVTTVGFAHVNEPSLPCVFVCGFMHKRTHNVMLHAIVNDLLCEHFVAVNSTSRWNTTTVRQALAGANVCVLLLNEFTLQDRCCLTTLQCAWHQRVPVVCIRGDRAKLVLTPKLVDLLPPHHEAEPEDFALDYTLLQELLFRGWCESVAYEKVRHEQSLARLRRRLHTVINNNTKMHHHQQKHMRRPKHAKSMGQINGHDSFFHLPRLRFTRSDEESDEQSLTQSRNCRSRNSRKSRATRKTGYSTTLMRPSSVLINEANTKSATAKPQKTQQTKWEHHAAEKSQTRKVIQPNESTSTLSQRSNYSAMTSSSSKTMLHVQNELPRAHSAEPPTRTPNQVTPRTSRVSRIPRATSSMQINKTPRMAKKKPQNSTAKPTRTTQRKKFNAESGEKKLIIPKQIKELENEDFKEKLMEAPKDEENEEHSPEPGPENPIIKDLNDKKLYQPTQYIMFPIKKEVTEPPKLISFPQDVLPDISRSDEKQPDGDKTNKPTNKPFPPRPSLLTFKHDSWCQSDSSLEEEQKIADQISKPHDLPSSPESLAPYIEPL